MTNKTEPDINGVPFQVCVYTVNIGNYEALREQPIAKYSKVPFICLTDNPTLTSESWKIEVIDPILPLDPTRTQRSLKIQPIGEVTNYRYQIYIDSGYILKKDPLDLLMTFPPTNGLTLFSHEFRSSLLDEFIENLKLGYDDSTRVLEQLNHYRFTNPDLLLEKPFHSALIISDKSKHDIAIFQRTWNAHVLRYSRRDQLSLNVALKLSGIKANIYDLNLYISPYVEYSKNRKVHRNSSLRSSIISQAPSDLRDYVEFRMNPSQMNPSQSLQIVRKRKSLREKVYRTFRKLKKNCKRRICRYWIRDIILRIDLVARIRSYLLAHFPKFYQKFLRRHY